MSKQIKEISVVAIYDNQGKIEGFVAYDEKLRAPVFYSSKQATVAEVKSLLIKVAEIEPSDSIMIQDLGPIYSPKTPAAVNNKVK